MRSPELLVVAPFRRFALAAFLALGLGACATRSAGRPSLLPTTATGPFVAGYHPYWAGDAWESYPFDVLDELLFFEIEAGADGTLQGLHGWPDDWQPLVQKALDHGVQVVPTISMHDPEAFQVVFADPALIARLADSTLRLLDDNPDLAGLHLDFEVFQPVALAARDGFTAYVALLASRLRAKHAGKSLSVFALAFDDDDVYNEQALGQLADYLVVQGYDYHSAGSVNAGPVGATRGWGRLNWETVVSRFEFLGIPTRKLVMGVPLYGYEWPVESAAMGAPVRGPGRTVPLAAAAEVLPGEPRAIERALRHGTRRDPESGVPWYAFEAEDGWIQGWFEDAESLQAKYDFVRRRGLGGIAVFPLAYGTPDLWEGLRRALR